MSRPGLAAASACFASALAWATSYRIPPPYPPDPQYYVLYGEVTGYIKYDKAICPVAVVDAECSEAWGLELDIVETLYTPDRTYARAQIFGFMDHPSCVPPPLPGQEECVPLGAKLKVSARRIQSDDPSSKVLRLDHFFRPVSIVERLPDSTDLDADSRTARDYRFAEDNGSESQLFELRKDFARLRTASPRQAADIIRRLAYYDGDKSTFDGSPSREDMVWRLVVDHGLDGAAAEELRSVARDADLLSKARWPDDTYNSPFDQLVRLAEYGDSLAQAALGFRFLEDDEFEKAIIWLDAADSGGYPLAQAYSALAYWRLADEHDEGSGDGVAPTLFESWDAVATARLDRALDTARKLAKNGDPSGLVMFAVLYGDEDAYEGEGLLPDTDEVQRYACAGVRFRPIWQRPNERAWLYSAVERRAGGCDRFTPY